MHHPPVRALDPEESWSLTRLAQLETQRSSSRRRHRLDPPKQSLPQTDGDRRLEPEFTWRSVEEPDSFPTIVRVREGWAEKLC